MKLRFTRRAIDNIGAVADFLRTRNPGDEVVILNVKHPARTRDYSDL